MRSEPVRVEIITGRERRCHYTANDKLALVDATMQSGNTVSAVARINGASASPPFKWRQLMSQGGQVAVKADEDVAAASRPASLNNACVNMSAFTAARPWKSRYSRSRSLPPGERVRLAASLGPIWSTRCLARLNAAVSTGARVTTSCSLPSDSSRALSNVRLSADYGDPKPTTPRVWRRVRQSQLCLPSHDTEPIAATTAYRHRSIRAHEGSVIALASNRRWSSDSLDDQLLEW